MEEHIIVVVVMHMLIPHVLLTVVEQITHQTNIGRNLGNLLKLI